MSVLHETERDRQVEREIIGMVARKWGCDGVHYCPTAYHVDAMLSTAGKMKCFAEARQRKNGINTYKTLLWSLQKYHHARQIGEYLPVFLIVEWDEGIFYTRINNEPLPVTYMNRSGKSSYRDDRDNEPCVEIDTSKFRCLFKKVKAA